MADYVLPKSRIVMLAIVIASGKSLLLDESYICTFKVSINTMKNNVFKHNFSKTF